MPACPKPEPRTRINARAKRQEASVKKSVRAECVERDGYCALAPYAWRLGPCAGKSEWAHEHSRRRSKTMKMPAAYRHDRRLTFMACTRHHRNYDLHEFSIVVGEAGMDGPFDVCIPRPDGWGVR
jgi:hypothetical protein